MECLMTMQSGDIAWRFRAVSSSVSPLVTLDVDTLTLTASAESRFAAISKEVRVRVEGSKKRLIIVLPRSAGTFLISRFDISRKFSALSSRCTISLSESSRIPSRCRRLKDVCMRNFALPDSSDLICRGRPSVGAPRSDIYFNGGRPPRDALQIRALSRLSL